MAETVNSNNEFVGMLVYEYGYPQNPGIIREIKKDKHKTIYTVEWLNETKKRPKITNCAWLNDFESLIEDHQRKYETQTKLAEQLRKM